jgi:hypothetical protein
MILMLVLEAEGGPFLHEYWSILTDPAHVAVEITLTILLDVVLLGMLWPLIKGYFNARLARQHELLDKEHGIVHHDDHVHHGDHVHPMDEPETGL